MKKIILLAVLMMMVLASGCQKASDLISPTPTPAVTPDAPVETKFPTGTYSPGVEKATIHLSQTLKMTNDWTIIGDYDISLTDERTEDRVVLGTSAKEKNGQIMWDDTQYWTIAVLTEDGAYNLFSQRMSGQVYLEISEAFVYGLPTPIITAYIFSGTDREIRNYMLVEDYFEETLVYSTKEFSTGGVNCLYTTLPESDPK